MPLPWLASDRISDQRLEPNIASVATSNREFFGLFGFRKFVALGMIFPSRLNWCFVYSSLTCSSFWALPESSCPLVHAWGAASEY